MILVDTSIWIDHLRRANAELALWLAEGAVVQHPFVTAELALGSVPDRERLIAMLDLLPSAQPVDSPDLLTFVTARRLHGTGIGMVDAHLLASAARNRLRLWTNDRRLSEQAKRLDLSFLPGK